MFAGYGGWFTLKANRTNYAPNHDRSSARVRGIVIMRCRFHDLAKKGRNRGFGGAAGSGEGG
jgi:hypothetical protein